MSGKFKTEVHEVDLCVVGAGMSGYGAALAAARHGAKVVLMQDRPVLGGNASSEVRMHICGADRHQSIPHMRETGLMEEFRLKNAYLNPAGSYSRFDTLLYEDTHYHPNIILLLNCTCMDAEMDGERIASITGWQLNNEKYHKVKAKFFADCTGDGILAPLSGAEFRIGTDAKSEYNEPLGKDVPDDKTMGHTLMFSVRDTGKPCEFIAPEWANSYPECDDLPYGERTHKGGWFDGKHGYWWLEKGGEHDTIGETEFLRDELLKIVYGVWDHMKNHCSHKENVANYTIDWIGMVPGKRESRRYMGPHVLTQNDLVNHTKFDDAVCHGGWSMDDHNPKGFMDNRGEAKATVYHQCEAGYAIPWRSLYSRNVSNLLFAGRDISATHMAMSSTRVMGTCLVMGQAVGTGVAMLCKKGSTTPQMDAATMKELQQCLLNDDVYIPGVALDKPAVMDGATFSTEGGEVVTDGFSRQVKDTPHCVKISLNTPFEIELAKENTVGEVGLYLDTCLEDGKCLEFSWFHSPGYTHMPERMPKKYRLEIKEKDEWKELLREDCNTHRHIWHKVDAKLSGARLIVEELWGGGDDYQLFGFFLR